MNRRGHKDDTNAHLNAATKTASIAQAVRQ